MVCFYRYVYDTDSPEHLAAAAILVEDISNWHVWTYQYKYTVYTHIQIYVRTYMHTYTSYVYIHTHMYTHTYIHRHTYTCVRMCVRRCVRRYSRQEGYNHGIEITHLFITDSCLAEPFHILCLSWQITI